MLDAAPTRPSSPAAKELLLYSPGRMTFANRKFLFLSRAPARDIFRPWLQKSETCARLLPRQKHSSRTMLVMPVVALPPPVRMQAWGLRVAVFSNTTAEST